MFHLGIWMLPIAGIPLILILIWMYVLARRRSRRLTQSKGGSVIGRRRADLEN
jgi:hypothetical protein